MVRRYAAESRALKATATNPFSFPFFLFPDPTTRYYYAIRKKKPVAARSSSSSVSQQGQPTPLMACKNGLSRPKPPTYEGKKEEEENVEHWAHPSPAERERGKRGLLLLLAQKRAMKKKLGEARG